MARLTEEMVTARTRASDLSMIKKLNCWGGELQDISLLRRMCNVEVLSLRFITPNLKAVTLTTAYQVSPETIHQIPHFDISIFSNGKSLLGGPLCSGRRGRQRMTMYHRRPFRFHQILMYFLLRALLILFYFLRNNYRILSSVNKISSLIDVQYCKNLKELYVRKNEIKNINEICYLKDLPYLKALWLGENPCSLSDPLYRMTVIKNLPSLEKLDDVKIEPEERQDALKKGRELIHPEDYDYAVSSSPEMSPTRHAVTQRSPPASSRCSEPDTEEVVTNRKSYSPDYDQQPQQTYSSPPDNRYSQSNDRYEQRSYQNSRRANDAYEQNSYDNGGSVSSANSERYSNQTSNYPRNTESYVNNRKENLTDSRNTNYTNHQEAEVEYRQEPKEPYCVCSAHQCDRGSQMNISRCRESRRGSSSEGSGRLSPQKGHMDEDSYSHHNERSYRQYEDARTEGDRHSRPPTAYLNRRPITRNSNILSAVLCLIKELDYPSLEVVGIAVRCRMDEFDD